MFCFLFKHYVFTIFFTKNGPQSMVETNLIYLLILFVIKHTKKRN